jgi:hypothetical protein
MIDSMHSQLANVRSSGIALGAEALLLLIALTTTGQAEALHAVGVLGNTSGLSDRPIPYAYYTGIACDDRGRLYLAGAEEGFVVCDQDGTALAIVPLPEAGGARLHSLVARAGDSVWAVALDAGRNQSALYRIDTRPTDAAALKAERVLDGSGQWAVSPTAETEGRVIVGQSDVQKRKYVVVAVDARSAKSTELFRLDQPPGAMRPWRHLIQVDPDSQISIEHAGGINWSGRYDAKGERVGDAIAGQIVGPFRYQFGYGGQVRRLDLSGQKNAPGDCGAEAPEIRMPRQLVQIGDRHFFAGRGGAVEAAWSGTNFVYARRLGAIYLEELLDAGSSLHGIAYTTEGNADVQHTIEIPKNQPIGQLLQVGRPHHGLHVLTAAPVPEGLVLLYRKGQEVHVRFDGPAHLEFDRPLPEVKQVGQAAVLDKDLLLADPASGSVWRRALLDKTSGVTAWRGDLPGVVGLAVVEDAVWVATPTQVSRLASDGKQVQWTTQEPYQGIRRLAATPQYVYVCDTAAHVVDQLDAATGRRLARLGVAGQQGSALDHLNRPYAIAADLDGLYIADNGNGRVVVATTTLWHPEIARLPRQDAPVVAVTLPVRPPQAGRMSVNVYDQNDLTVRQLAAAQPSDQPVTWDGRDQYGQWAQPGRYRYHGLIAPKFSLRYVTSISQSGHPVYRTADGKGSWGGVWGNVMDICSVTNAPDSDIVVLWAFEEGEGGLIRMSQDGEVRWKQHLDWWMKARQMAVASDGRMIYVAASSALGAPEGQSNYSGELNRPLLWRVDAETGAKRPFPETDQQHQRMFGRYLRGERIVTDLAVADGKLYLTAPAQDTLFVADAQSGQQLAAWPIPQVSGIAIDAQRGMLAGSGSRIVRLDVQGKVVGTVAEAGGTIWDLDLAPDGQMAVSVGAPRHQVIYFDREGHVVRAIGQSGGRPLCGKMQPSSLLQPVGLCVTGGGKLLVAEDATPRRFTRWSADGRLERQFHGPYYYSGMFGIDEDEPEYVYGDTHGDLIRYKVDYQTGKWDVDRYWIGVYKDSHVPAKWWPRIRRKDGKTYWCSGSGGIVELRDDGFRGVAAVYGGWVEKQPDGNYRSVGHGKNTGLKGTWSDLNGDGQPQPEEWQVTDRPVYPASAAGPQQGWGSYFDERFDLYMHDWSDDEAGGVWKIPVAQWRGSVPVYRWDRAEHVGLPRGHGLAHGASGARTAFASGDGVYAFNGGYNAAGLPGVGHGHDWEFAQVTRYDARAGKPLWHAGQRAGGFIAQGEHYCPTGAAGLLGEYLFWTDENSLVHVWDAEHGLYVDTLLEDISRGPEPSPYTIWVELFNTRVFRHPVSGKVYLMAASDAIHIYEVLGTDEKPVRFQGEFELTEAQLASARQQVAARSASAYRTLKIPRASGAVKIDGDLGEFARAPAATMVLREMAQGTARLMADSENLYVAWEVEDDSPWKNAGGDNSALFKTGDTVDLWLGPSRGKRQPGTKDIRVLFAPNGPRAVVVAYRPKVEKDAKRVPFRSPSGEVWMDRVEVLSDVTVAVKTGEHGYRLEAAIPRSQLGLEPGAERIGLDLSINFSDPAGQRNVARIHWGRNGAAIVYDLPSEARFEPETWGEGILEMEGK